MAETGPESPTSSAQLHPWVQPGDGPHTPHSHLVGDPTPRSGARPRPLRLLRGDRRDPAAEVVEEVVDSEDL